MASIWDKLFPDQDYRTLAPAGGYADLYANSLLGNRTDTPASVEAMQTGKDFIPGIGDAIALKEAYDAASRGDKVAAGLLATATALGLIPGAGDAIARPILAAGRKMADVAGRIEVDPSAAGSMLGNVRFKKSALEGAAKQSDRSREILVDMPIDDFLKAAKKEVSLEKLDGTRRLVGSGEAFDTVPSLTFSNNGDGTGKVVGHDGRHRAMALREAGEDTIPVLLSNQAGDGPSIRYGVQNDPTDRDYIDILPQSLIEEDGLGEVRMPSAAANIRQSPTLPLPSNRADAMAKQVLDMRAAGNAGDVTDEMMALADDQYMYANTPLDMGSASRTARSAEMGFSTGRNRMDPIAEMRGEQNQQLVHYTDKDFPAFDLPEAQNRQAVWATPDPSLNLATKSNWQSFGDEGVNGMPIVARVNNRVSPLEFRLAGDPMTPAFPSNVTASDVARANSVGADHASAGMEYAIFDPTNIRSRFARFDPEFAHLKNLSAGVGAAPVGLLALREEQKRANEERYNQGLLQ